MLRIIAHPRKSLFAVRNEESGYRNKVEKLKKLCPGCVRKRK